MSNMTAEFEAIGNLLQQLPDNIQKKVVVKSTREAAKHIRDAARAAAPVKSGKLKKAIKVKTIRKKFTKRGHVKSQVYVDKKILYAGAIEYGTSTKPAQPYMRTAFYSAGPEATAVFQDYAKETTQAIIDDLARQTGAI